MKRTEKKNVWLKLLIFVVLVVFLITGGRYVYDKWLVAEYPIRYEQYVERYSKEFGLDSVLVYAVIKTESSYDPSVVSNVGARGLMQIMEETFDWIKYRLDDEDTVYRDMFDPELNIRYGCYLLGSLYGEFGDVDTAVAAYHAGRGAVNKWLDDPNYSSDGVHLDVIPIPATAHYVDKINRAMSIYENLYEFN